jgi:hypothetical protein
VTFRIRSSLLPLLVAAVCWVPACRNRSAGDDANSLVPAGAAAIAGVDLTALRRSALFAQMPEKARPFLESAPGASRLLLAWNGNSLLTIAEGDFLSAPAGFTLITRRLAAAGTADAVNAARLQHQSGRSGAPDLTARAADLAPGHAIWVIANGSAPLPLAGNLGNIAGLLAYTRYSTVAARIDDRLTLDGKSICADAAKAGELEEKLRALLSLFSMMTSRRPDLAAIANSIRIETTGDTVQVHVALSPEASAKAMALAAR